MAENMTFRDFTSWRTSFRATTMILLKVPTLLPDA
jgi:hypothetical protein